MKYLISILFVCATLQSVAQTNFVKNGDFERYDTCPFEPDNLYFAKYWRSPIDSTFVESGEYYNSCGNVYLDHISHVPHNTGFYQYPHSGFGLIALDLFYDKTPPRPPFEASFNYRNYAQVRLYKNLILGKTYCVSFWVVKTESYCYAHNKIGAYLDDGSINSAVDSAGKEITSVIPQIYTNTIIKDTMSWTKIEGSFVATGNENVITIGNFFPNSAVDTTSTDCTPGGLPQYSYYLIDDVSVVPIDAKANAGVDRWVELSKSTQIGPVEDSTARGMDCKWYKKGVLIDSGNVITVKASTIKYAVDTYIVVQNVCGNITRDTMLLKTVGLGMSEMNIENTFSIYPNPSNGNISISCFIIPKESITANVYDLLGRVVHQELLNFSNKEATLILNIPRGSYILELKDEAGNVQRERIVLE